jgi:hypothetical protein
VRSGPLPTGDALLNRGGHGARELGLVVAQGIIACGYGGGAAPGGGWPGRSHAGTPGRATPDRPGVAPCAGVAWPTGALRGSVAGTAQAGARCLLVPGESSRWARGVHYRNALRALRLPLAPALRTANGVRPSALSPSPPGEAMVCGQFRSPHGQSAPLSPACQPARPAERPRQLAALPAPALRGCQPITEES